MEARSTNELTLRALLLGLVIGFFFALGNAYLGLRAGITVSASIPAAVLSMALLRLFAKRSSILEANMVQTIASAGQAVATGAIFTVPALLFLGERVSTLHTFSITLLGGLLGILWMVPVRHALIVVEEKRLPFPEGRACAEVLKAKSAPRGQRAWLCIWGLIIGETYKILQGIVHLWPATISWTVYRIKSLALDTTPALSGIGYMIGTRYALTLFAGGFFAWWGLIPLISIFESGELSDLPIDVPAPVESAAAIWSHYIRYIGTGTLAASGIVSLLRYVPLIFRVLAGHLREVFRDIFARQPKKREERDLPFLWVLLGTLVIILLLFLLPNFRFNWIAVTLLILLVIHLVALTAIVTGLIGVSSNPVPGLMIFTLVVTGLVFVALGWTDRVHLLMAMTLGSVIGVSIAIAGDTAQDLKTGHIVGATPVVQQVAMMIGILIPGVTLGWIIRILNQTYVVGSEVLPAPQATVMYLVIDGLLQQKIPLLLCVTGAVIGLAVELMGVLSLPFALGIFLPFSTTTAIGLGGVLRYVMGRFFGEERAQERGILLGSGLIAGDALTGIIVALVVAVGWVDSQAPSILGPWTSVFVYLILIAIFIYMVGKKSLKGSR